jgi:type II secretion system protein J
MKRARNQSLKAFTLLEILAATAMFLVVTGAFYSLFYGALRLRDSAHDAIDRELPRDHAVKTMRRDLALCMPPAGIMAVDFKGERDDIGTGRSDTLAFYSVAGNLSEDKPWGDVMKIEYALDEEAEDGETGSALKRSVTRNLLASIADEPETSLLLKGAKSLEFSYYDGSTWEDFWDSAARDGAIPEAVKARIEFAEVEDGFTPSPLALFVPLAVKAPASGAGTDDPSESGSSGGEGGAR